MPNEDKIRKARERLNLFLNLPDNAPIKLVYKDKESLSLFIRIGERLNEEWLEKIIILYLVKGDNNYAYKKAKELSQAILTEIVK